MTKHDLAFSSVSMFITYARYWCAPQTTTCYPFPWIPPLVSSYLSTSLGSYIILLLSLPTVLVVDNVVAFICQTLV